MMESRNLRPTHRERWILISALLAALILWIVTIGTTYIQRFPPDPFYYLRQLPSFYWIGILIVCVTLVIMLLRPRFNTKRNKLIDLALVTLFMLYLFGTPCFIYPTTRYLDAYEVSKFTTTVAESGQIGKSEITWYDSGIYESSFPGAIICFSMFTQITGTEMLDLAKFYPLLLMGIICLLIYAIASRIAPQYAIMAPVALLGISWVQGYHLSPQAHAFILSTVFILLFSLSFNRGSSTYCLFHNLGTPTRLLVVIIWIAIVTSHPSTIVILLLFLVFIAIIYEILRLLEKYNTISSLPISLHSRSLYQMVLLFIVIYVSYTTFQADFILADTAELIKETGLSLLQGGEPKLTSDIVATPSQLYVTTNYFRWFCIIGSVLLGIVATGYSLYKGNDKTIVFLFSSFLAANLGLAAFLIFTGYNVYGYDRAYMFFTIPFGIISSIAIGLSTQRQCLRILIFQICLVGFGIISICLIPITYYGSDPYEFISEPQQTMMNFHCSISPESPSRPPRYAELRETSYNLYNLIRQESNIYTLSFQGPSNIALKENSKFYVTSGNAVYMYEILYR
ncbi:MAG: hypothetical protein SVY53_16070 [Chloroflexota bacterium]|nr:hypothetical protein [Chloroflexota bacterium]